MQKATIVLELLEVAGIKIWFMQSDNDYPSPLILSHNVMSCLYNRYVCCHMLLYNYVDAYIYIISFACRLVQLAVTAMKVLDHVLNALQDTLA